MNSTPIIEVIMKVIYALERLGIAYDIGGSLASSAFGIPRSSLDVDLVANIKLDQASPLVDLLKEEFYVDVEMVNGGGLPGY